MSKMCIKTNLGSPTNEARNRGIAAMSNRSKVRILVVDNL